MKTTTLTVLTIALAALLGTSVAAQSATQPAAAGMPIIYPAKGQSPQQQDKDKYQCYGWAREQSGFDPMQAAPQQAAQPGAQQSAAPTAPPTVSGGALVKGAAVGAAAGELASNDAGRGAAAGALTGVVLQNVKQRQAAPGQAAATGAGAGATAGATASRTQSAEVDVRPRLRRLHGRARIRREVIRHGGAGFAPRPIERTGVPS